MIDASLLENPNLAMLEIAVHALGDLCESLVFVGGCATGLLVTTVRAHHIRATEDVDVVAKVATVSGYHDARPVSWREASNTTPHRRLRSAAGSAPAQLLTLCLRNREF